ncbi:MAG: helix-hairpin-helix domain-containing protein [Salinarchaeum sp.]
MIRRRIADAIRRNELLIDTISILTAHRFRLVRRGRRLIGATTVDTDDRTPTVRVEYAPTDASTPVTAIEGIGPTRSEHLEAAGIETVTDLLTADLDAVAAETGLSRARLDRWYERAQEQ